MTKSEYFTGSNITNYCVTTAYLQDAPMLVLRDLADRIQEEFCKRNDAVMIDEESILTEKEGKPTIATKKKVDYTKEINTDRPIEKGMELIPLGRLETKDEYLLDILKENGFYLMYQKRETKFGEWDYWQVLYPKEDL